MIGPGFSGVGLLRRAERAAKARALSIAYSLAERIDSLPGVSAVAESGRVMIRGRRLKARRLIDERLRWFAGWLR